MTAPKAILDLIERFELHKDAYKGSSYNETQVRREFVDPFFKALGWDIDNEQGYAEAYKDVVHEDALKVGGNTTAPDYAFRIGGTRKFFLEAKRPSINIKDDVSAAYQLRRYAWSAKLPLSVLTDFEELAVYDCRVKPEKGDKASVARVAYFTHDEYAERWDEIESVFSREAILKGSFDKYADDNKRKRGTAEVDDAFLEEIEAWREALATNLVLRNTGLTVRELNTAVQRTIDRIIFLRIAEDRGIEPYGQIQNLSSGKGVYSSLIKLFQRADERYNSGLFHFRKGDGSDETLDTFTLNLSIDDKVLKPILGGLYYPDSPYEFSVLPADILGQVYERFLGKVIRLTNKRAIIEEKPETKKAGGVYYTPTYVVRYIVKNAIAPMFEGRTPSQVSGLDKRVRDARPLRVVDPACGSGSFLIEAYQYLLDWYRDRYIQEGTEKHSKGKDPTLLQVGKGAWRLTISERRRILLTHIYGVDIDPQAVEVTKLSLLLKVLEGETADNVARQMDFFNVRVLPDLGANIRCGNSLVSSDFYSQYDLGLLSEDELFRINAFDWSDEFAFCDGKGGFDAIVGNPPYGATLVAEEKKYFKDKYQHQSYQFDSYLLFVERAISKLLREDGYFGMIIPNPWLTNLNQAALRTYVVGHTTLKDIVHFNFQVFSRAKAIVDTEIVIFKKQAPRRNKFTTRFVSELAPSGEIETFDGVIEHKQSDWLKIADQSLNIFLDERRVALAAQIRTSGERCDRLLRWQVGMKPYQAGKGVPKQTRQDVQNRKFDSDVKVDGSYRQYVRGTDFERFFVRPLQERWIKYGPWLAEPRLGAQFDSPQKILVRQTGDSLVAAIDTNKFICMNNVHVGVAICEGLNLYYIMGVLNSALMNWIYHSLNPEMGEALAEVKKENVARLPIIKESTDNVRLVKEIAQHALNLENLRRRTNESKVETDRTQLLRREKAELTGLNEKVFALYGIEAADRSVILMDEAKVLRRKSRNRAATGTG